MLSDRARDRRRDRIEKAADYAAFGVRLYVLVDPEERTFEALERVQEMWVVAASATSGRVGLSGCDGLVLDLDDLWKEVGELEPAG